MLKQINSMAKLQFRSRNIIKFAEETFGKVTIRKLGLQKISSDQVHLKPELMK